VTRQPKTVEHGGPRSFLSEKFDLFSLLFKKPIENE